MSMYYNIEPVSFCVCTWFLANLALCDAKKKLKTKRWNDIPGTIAIRLETNRRIFTSAQQRLLYLSNIYTVYYHIHRKRTKKEKKKQRNIYKYFFYNHLTNNTGKTNKKSVYIIHSPVLFIWFFLSFLLLFLWLKFIIVFIQRTTYILHT